MTLPALHTMDIPYGHRVLLRSSLNVPIHNGEVTGVFRLREAARTVMFLRQRGARVTVIGHLGREGKTIAPVHKKLNEMMPIAFLPKLTGEEVYASRKRLQPGDALLLENTRSDPREEENDLLFAEELAAQADLFVFDDFAAAHRSHASTVGLIAQLPSCVGIRFYEEMTGLLRITERLVPPALAIVGGAKCETKLPLLENLAKTYDTVFVAGVAANTILRQRGYDVGKSVTEDVQIPPSLRENRRIVTPHDVLVAKDRKKTYSIPIGEVQPDDTIVDIGDGSLRVLGRYLETAKTVVMNGPLGWLEKGFSQQTIKLSRTVAASNTYSFIGGGDTVALLERANRMSDWQFVSTGGGSLLHHLSADTLPVIEAFEKKRSEQQNG